MGQERFADHPFQLWGNLRGQVICPEKTVLWSRPPKIPITRQKTKSPWWECSAGTEVPGQRSVMTRTLPHDGLIVPIARAAPRTPAPDPQRLPAAQGGPAVLWGREVTV